MTLNRDVKDDRKSYQGQSIYSQMEPSAKAWGRDEPYKFKQYLLFP